MKKKYRPKRTPPLKINIQQLDNIVDKACLDPISHEEGEVLKTSIHAMAERLTRRYDPRTTERAKALLRGEESGGGQGGVDSTEADKSSTAPPGSGEASPSQVPEKKRPGHGRNGAAKYTGVTIIEVPHQDMISKCTCPGCSKGKVYDLRDPAVRLRIEGMPPASGKLFRLQRLRCNLCGQVFVAEVPAGIGEDKYDASVASLVALFRYGSGIPFYRIEKFQAQMGVPLPSGTQFDLVDEAAVKLRPVHEELKERAAHGRVLYNDDTSVRILDEIPVPEGHDKDRTGLHTTGVISEAGDHRIAVFTSGPNHAGENMGELLEQRDRSLPAPIVMNDALPHNTSHIPEDLEAVLLNCLTHGRRQFADIFEAFPQECRYVIEELALVYRYDAEAREHGLDPQARLSFHQENSSPVMERLKEWMTSQLQEGGSTEPNSGLGKAIRYMLKRWDRLTGFLRLPGAPVDNNVAERALKKAVLQRKNSLFYKTLHGAEVGDLFLSIIHTCELNNVNAFKYITELQRHAEEVGAHPEAWLPWNFHLQLPALLSGSG